MLADKFSGFRVEQTAGAVAVRACLANTFPLSASSLGDEEISVPVRYHVDVVENDVHVFVGQSKEGDIFNQCSRTIGRMRIIYWLFHIFVEYEHIAVRLIRCKLITGRQLHRRQLAGFIGEPVAGVMIRIVLANQCFRAAKRNIIIVLHRNDQIAGRFIQNTILVCAVSC